MTDRPADVQGARQVVHDGVEQRLHADVAQRGAAEHGEHARGERGAPQGLAQQPGVHLAAGEVALRDRRRLLLADPELDRRLGEGLREVAHADVEREGGDGDAGAAIHLRLPDDAAFAAYLSQIIPEIERGDGGGTVRRTGQQRAGLRDLCGEGDRGTEQFWKREVEFPAGGQQGRRRLSDDDLGDGCAVGGQHSRVVNGGVAKPQFVTIFVGHGAISH